MNKALLACGLIVAACAAPAMAEPSGTLVVQANRYLAANQRAVPYADLQLASVAGQKQLRERVGLAIADLCDPSHFSVSEPHGSLKCSAQAWADIAPRLSQLSPRLASR